MPWLLLLLLVAHLFGAQASTSTEKRVLERICEKMGVTPGVSIPIEFPRLNPLACEREMFDEELELDVDTIWATPYLNGHCFACVKKDWLLDHYCALPLPTDRSNYYERSRENVMQERGKTRLGKWRGTNSCNTCSEGTHGLCTMLACGNVWVDKIYSC